MEAIKPMPAIFFGHGNPMNALRHNRYTGTWSVLSHVFPQADVPVVQLSIDNRQPPTFHYELGSRLEPLRDEGVLIIGSGNIVHNLACYAWRQPDRELFAWGVRFEQRAREFMLAGDVLLLLPTTA